MQQKRLMPPLAQTGSPRVESLRRVLLVACLFFVLVFVLQALGSVGIVQEVDTSKIKPPLLFATHAVLMVSLMSCWYLIGYSGSPRGRSEFPPDREPGSEPAPGSTDNSFAGQFGLRAQNIAQEIGIGVVAGVVGWFGVMVILIVLVFLMGALGGEGLVPTEAPELIPWMVGLPVALRALLALSAGVVEELFFRGFLQSRAGIVLSTLLFAVAHLSYDQPFMLVGITLLSLLFAFLVHWRGNIWSAMVAHTVFDALQLLVVIPAILRVAGALPGPFAVLH